MTNAKGGASRRTFLMNTGRAAAATSAFAGLNIPLVHAGQDSTIQLAVVGCGGRGTGAVGDALSVGNQGPIQLAAMADLFEDRLNSSAETLSKNHAERGTVVPEKKFIGFDAYKQAMDCLKPGDVVILTTPPAFRWVQFKYAIEKGLNVFMEKPVTVDGPTSRKMLELGQEAAKKNLKVAVGLMCRHCAARQELYDRIRNGEIGDIILMRGYRVLGPTGSAFVEKKPAETPEIEHQIRHFHGFLWASGGAFSDFLIHNIDECCWMKDAWPIEAKGFGGRHYRENYVDQNFDTYTVEYTFDDGSKFIMEGRCMTGCHQEFASYAHGSKNSAVISTSSHSPAKCRIYNGQKIGKRKEEIWAFPQPEPSPYQLEWDHLIAAIRQDQPYNEVERGVKASLVTSMGRMACHTGQVITYDEMLNCEHEFAPTVGELALAGPAPVQSDADGKYPVPQPGIVKNREY